MRAPADAERAASVGHRETFDVDAFATACASALGFDADAVEDAVEILMECAPTLVEKNVVAIDASFVRPRPRASPIFSRCFFYPFFAAKSASSPDRASPLASLDADSTTLPGVSFASQRPNEWHACAAFVAAGVRRAADEADGGSAKKNASTRGAKKPPPSSPSSIEEDASKRSLTRVLTTFDVNCVDFFRALRKFMMANATALHARVKRSSSAGAKGTSASASKSPRSAKSSSPMGSPMGSPNAKNARGVDGASNPAGEGLNQLEADLSVSELRTSFAFTRVVAQKYKLFLDLHFDRAAPGGADLARLGWSLFLAAKHAMLPKFPDLYSLYHLLVVVQAFVLVNAPPRLLRTSLVNMVSMSEKDADGKLDALASLSVSSKTKIDQLRDMLKDFERDVVQGEAFAADFARLSAANSAASPGRAPGMKRSPARGAATAATAAAAATVKLLKPSPPASMSASGPSRFLGLIPDTHAKGDDAAVQALKTAAAAAKATYERAATELGHLSLDEQLYLANDAYEESAATKVLGDTSKAPKTGGSGGVAATPGPGGVVAATPWRGAGAVSSLLGPSPMRLGAGVGATPFRGGAGGGGGGGGSIPGGGASGLGGIGGVPGGRISGPGAVPFTPISEAMASASWLHGVVSPRKRLNASGADAHDPVVRLSRFVSVDVAKKLMASVTVLAGKTSAALREDAFLVAVNGVAAARAVVTASPGDATAATNASLDSLVKRRQEEAVKVFAYFMVRILENEHKRNAHVAGGKRRAVDEAKKAATTAAATVAAGGAPSSRGAHSKSLQKSKDDLHDAHGSVADIAALAAEQSPPDTPAGLIIVPDPTPTQKLAFESLLGSSRFVRSVLSCAAEVVVASYKTATLKFPAIPTLLGLDAFDVSNVIEPFVRADATMPREIKKHFNAIEEKIMEHMAWRRGSTLLSFMIAAETGAPAPRPAAAALAAVSKQSGATERGSMASKSPASGGVKRERSESFSVAAVAEEAEDDDGGGGGAAAAADDARASPPRLSNPDAINAFSTPLRGATTPARPSLRSIKPRDASGATTVVTISGPGALDRDKPLPTKFTREKPPGAAGDVTARNSLRIFFAKVMRLSARRLADLCDRLSLPSSLTQQAYSLVEHALYDNTSLLYNRHLDQIILCAVYGTCKVNKDGALKGKTVPFRDIIYHYQKQPQCREEVFWTVVMSQSDPELEVITQGDIIAFYNKVFVPAVKQFLLSLKPQARVSCHETQETAGADAATSPPASSAQLPVGLQSPRKQLTAVGTGPAGVINRNVYVSPMRGGAAARADLHAGGSVGPSPSPGGVPYVGAPGTPLPLGAMTPGSKSLFAFVGESTHAYASPAQDLAFINQRVAAAAAADAGAGGVASVAEAAEAARAAPPAAVGQTRRAPTFDEADDGRPPKAARR